METKHTPGPWATIANNYFVNHHGRGLQSVYCAQHPNWPLITVGAASDTAREEVNANARLIAAAPELLAALKDALRNVDEWETRTGYRQFATWISDTRAAIAKAEGRS